MPETTHHENPDRRPASLASLAALLRGEDPADEPLPGDPPPDGSSPGEPLSGEPLSGEPAFAAPAPGDPAPVSGNSVSRAFAAPAPSIPADDEILDAFCAWADEQGTPLWPHQEEAALALMAGEHVILGTPTGSGKSLVAQALLFKALCRGDGRACYTAPIKALVNEKYFAMANAFGSGNVGMITGDVVVNPEAPLVCCTAEILAMDSLRREGAAGVRYVVMDEFHFFGDVDRGWAWQVPLLMLSDAQFLLMSATLGDTSQVAGLLEERTGAPAAVVDDAPRPVPLAFDYVETPLEATVELALREGRGPLYIVHFSQRSALESARRLASFGVAGKEERRAVQRACRGFDFSTAFGKTLQRLLGLGVGVHHAGMLPRYRLLVEKLAQQGLLPVICGTDTLGVGINVPIRTVLVTGLTKYDGHRQRRLKAREFHQIAGRAGRAGFDTEGEVLVQAPDYAIENARARAKCGGDEKKLRRLKLKQPRPGAVTWNRQTFDKLVAARPETLRPRMKVTHAMVLALAQRGGDVRKRLAALIGSSLQQPGEKPALLAQADEIVDILLDARVLAVERVPVADEPTGGEPGGVPGGEPTGGAFSGPSVEKCGIPSAETPTHSDIAPECVHANGGGRPVSEPNLGMNAAPAPEAPPAPAANAAPSSASAPVPVPVAASRLDPGAGFAYDYHVTAELPEDLALDQPLSPFLLAALELLDPESDAYTLDLISLAEAIAENPRQLLQAQERQARAAAVAQMKADGVPYEERVERVEEVTYPKPLEDLLADAFALYCESVPWARDYEIAPKSLLREMVEGGHTFKSYVAAYKVADSEGALLRYLADVYRILDRTVPYDKCTDLLEEVISWLHMTVVGTDRSLFEDWGGAGAGAGEGGAGEGGAGVDAAAPGAAVVTDRRGLTLMVRNALFTRVKLAARPGDAAGAGNMLLLDGFEVRAEGEAQAAPDDIAASAAALGELDAEWGFGERAWRQLLEEFYGRHAFLRSDADARGASYFELDERDEEAARVWHVRQLFLDDAADLDFRIEADLDLDASQQRAEAVFASYRVHSL